MRVESGLSATELGDRYRAADVFVCLSEHEGFCIPLLEAMHFGLPVIARSTGAVPEVAGDAALLCEQHEYRDRAIDGSRAEVCGYADIVTHMRAS